MALAAERAKYGLPAEFKVTREMKRDFTPQEKQMYKTAYEIGGAKRANEVGAAPPPPPVAASRRCDPRPLNRVGESLSQKVG